MKSFKCTVAALVISALAIAPLNAVVIEGFTPNGTFKAVGLTVDGSLNVAVTGGTFLTLSGNETWTNPAGPGNAATLILASNGVRRGELVCNYGSTDVRVGSTTVTTNGLGALLRGGNDSCYSADGLSVYTGALFANATGAYVLDVVEITP
jgi:hypothetical protein